ncbi:MAG: RsmE family RNA methyltransferase, partial [Anaerolineales bacterium]|nr:RsmE family RNA methyltransferase [Anaerolineales bacterium]
LLPWEAAAGPGVAAALAGRAVGRVALFIGPEGGFEDAEVAAARAAGVQPVTLGRRILRAETAAVAAAALVMQAMGELE